MSDFIQAKPKYSVWNGIMVTPQFVDLQIICIFTPSFLQICQETITHKKIDVLVLI